jgi:hypothetical protein
VRRAAAIVALAVPATLAGCGGDSVDRNPETPADWAQSVCVVLGDWRDEVRAVGEEFAEGDSLTTDSLRDAADQLEEANEDLVRQLRRIDAPETGSVSDARDAVTRLAEQVDERRGEVEEAIEEAESQPGAASVFDAISVVAAALRDTARDVREALEDLEDTGSEAVSALREASACRDLAGEDDAPEGS